jgi:hypothetical protein
MRAALLVLAAATAAASALAGLHIAAGDPGIAYSTNGG